MNPVAVELARSLIATNPNAAARKVEGAAGEEVAQLLVALGSQSATILLKHLVPLAGAEALAQMEAEEAGRIIERLGPNRAAVIMARLKRETAARLMSELSASMQANVRRLLEFRADQAGSRMDPKAPAVSAKATTGEALALVRNAADSALHYVYVVDEEHHLIGVASMRELMLAQPTALLSSIMTPSPARLRADDPIQSVVVNPGWRRTHALPVVDEQGRYLGAFRYSTFRGLETELGQARSGPNGARTAEALAELLWIGTSAMGRMTGAAIFGTRGEEEPQ